MDAGVVLVGGGVGAVSVARRLRKVGYAGPLTLVSDEGLVPYDRPPLSKQFLAGSLNVRELELIPPNELDSLDLAVETGCAIGLDPVGRELVLDGGFCMPYSAVVVATGARARRLPFGDGLAGVRYLRTLADAERLTGDLGPGRRLVVVGGGFIGLEVAATAFALGTEVTVLEAASQPLTRVLGPSAGVHVTALHAERADLRFGVSVTGIVGDGRVRAVCVGGEEIAADAVVIGVGALPNTEWLAGSGVLVDDGVVCDDGGRASVPGVYAVGDVARWRHALTGMEQRVEQWQTAVEQATIVAANIAVEFGVANASPESWTAVPYFWSDQYEHKIQFCGRPGAMTADRPVRRGVVACFADSPGGAASGVLAVDNPAALARGRRMVAAGTPWSEMVAWLESL